VLPAATAVVVAAGGVVSFFSAQTGELPSAALAPVFSVVAVTSCVVVSVLVSVVEVSVLASVVGVSVEDSPLFASGAVGSSADPPQTAGVFSAAVPAADPASGFGAGSGALRAVSVLLLTVSFVVLESAEGDADPELEVASFVGGGEPDVSVGVDVEVDGSEVLDFSEEVASELGTASSVGGVAVGAVAPVATVASWARAGWANASPAASMAVSVTSITPEPRLLPPSIPLAANVPLLSERRLSFLPQFSSESKGATL